jgi:hypothetical protein
MARPQKFNAEYFSHDAGMRNDTKVKALRRKFKEGYAVWNMLLEYLTDAEHFQFQATPLTLELLGGDFDIEPERLKSIIDYCIEIGLLQEAQGIIASRNHKERFKTLLSKRKPSESGVSGVDNPHSIVKDSIGKNRKVEDSKAQEHVGVVEPLVLAEFSEKEKKRPDEIEERLNWALDQSTLDGIRVNARMAYPGVDIDKEIARFRLKVKTSPRVYAGHDTEALRQAFNFQLRGAAPEKPTRQAKNFTINV